MNQRSLWQACDTVSLGNKKSGSHPCVFSQIAYFLFVILVKVLPHEIECVLCPSSHRNGLYRGQSAGSIVVASKSLRKRASECLPVLVKSDDSYLSKRTEHAPSKTSMIMSLLERLTVTEGHRVESKGLGRCTLKSYVVTASLTSLQRASCSELRSITTSHFHGVDSLTLNPYICLRRSLRTPQNSVKCKMSKLQT